MKTETPRKYLDIKRIIGRAYNDAEVQKLIPTLPYKIINDLGSVKIRINDETSYYPEEISAFIISRMKSIAESRIHREVTKAVVTVPIYFNDFQIQATKDAAIIAGLKDVTILSEPEAAAIAIFNHYPKNFKGNVFIYNLSRFYFDASVVTIDNGVCKVKATRSDCSFGGKDIDKLLEMFLTEDYKSKYGKELEHTYVRRILGRASQKLKVELSYKYTVDICLSLQPDCDYTTSLTRLRLEKLTADLFDKTITIVNDCLQDSALKKTDINEVLLVGGSSKMLKVKQILQEYFGEDRIKNKIDPQEIVAFGAAVHASSLVNGKEEVIEVISESLGINMDEDIMRVIFPRHTPIPTKIIKLYQTVKDNQNSMSFSIYFGEDNIASKNQELGSFAMANLTKAQARDVKVEVCYEIDVKGILCVSATEINNPHNSQKVVIDLRERGFINCWNTQNQ